eukprot:300291-Rhodomonas_salina.1
MCAVRQHGLVVWQHVVVRQIKVRHSLDAYGPRERAHELIKAGSNDGLWICRTTPAASLVCRLRLHPTHCSRIRLHAVRRHC